MRVGVPLTVLILCIQSIDAQDADQICDKGSELASNPREDQIDELRGQGATMMKAELTET
jgi:hypothetical protein